MPDDSWTFKIDKGIPIPGIAKTKQRNKRDSIRWNELEIGDSFVWENQSSGGLKKRAEAAGIKILIKQTKSRPGPGAYPREYRIWRIE